MKRLGKEQYTIMGAGSIFAVLAVLLVMLGNPLNMGFCIACFYRDIAGALSLHSAAVVQYVRPEIIGLFLGASAMALLRKEHKSRGGSSALTRFVISFFVMIGALVFLGCPFRMLLRIGGGDLNAVVALLGFASGVVAGSILLNKGFSLGRSYTQGKVEGSLPTIIALVLLAVLLFLPSLLKFSTSGPGSMHAPILISLAAGAVVGLLAQRTRFCMAGGIRDIFLFRDPTLLLGSAAVIVVALVLNVATGTFKLGFAGQPVAHTDWLWNFLGMGLVGYGSTLLGGCPLRQTILAAEGNTDSAMSVLGMVAGAAFAHNLGLASSGAGPTLGGKVAVAAGFALLTLIALLVIRKNNK